MARTENVRPHFPLVLMKDIRRAMFAAHDEQEHTLTYSPIANGWMLEGKRYSEMYKHTRHGLLRTLPNLVRGLSELERVSGISSDKFTITDNPYYRD